MAESIEHWLNNQAGLKVNVLSYEKEFANGYYFGQIFFNYGMLPAFLDYFQNKPQSVYRETNFDLLEPCFAKIGIKFDSNMKQSIRREELGFAKKLVYKMKSEFANIKDNANFSNKSGMNEAIWSIHNRAKRMGMSNKLEKTERNLEKFEDEFLKQKNNARTLKEIEEKRYKEAVQRFRDERRTNLKLNHDYMKEWESNLTTLWKHSRVTIKELKDVRIRFNGMMTEKIKKEEDRRTQIYTNELQKGITEFEDNANRLGVELFHDPDRTDKVEKAPFNLQAMMHKVKIKSELNEASRKQKESRERHIKLKQERLAVELEKQSIEQKKIERHIKISRQHCSEAESRLIEEDQENFINKNREAYFEKRKIQETEEIGVFLKSLKVISDEEYEKKAKETRFVKQKFMLDERIKEYDEDYRVCASVMESLFEMSDVLFIKLEAEEKAHKREQHQVPLKLFKELIKRFVEQQTLYDEAPEEAQLKSTILNYTKLQGSDKFTSEGHGLENYMRSDQAFAPQLTYNVFLEQKSSDTTTRNEGYTKLMIDYVNYISPTNVRNLLPAEYPNFAPIRISIIGNSFTGKKTIAKRLSQLMGIRIIDADRLIEKAKGLVKQEESDQPESVDVKKKVPAGAGLKGGKKAAESAPVQLTEAELEMQRIGVKIKNMETAQMEIGDDIKIDLILIELKYLMPEKSYFEVKRAFNEAKQKAEEKKNQRKEKETEVKNTLDNKKLDKNKLSNKSLAKEVPNTSSQSLQLNQDELFEEKYPYLKGYILLNFPSSAQQAE